MKLRAYAAENPDFDERLKSSSGGIFSLLAKEVLASGGSVYGATFDNNWSVVHSCVTSEDDLYKLRGSKYVYSRLGQSILDAVSKLSKGIPVLFSGTPCQAAAMRKQAGQHPLLTIIEVICHGAPEAKYWERYLDEICARENVTRADITSIKFRDKTTGWKNYSFSITFGSAKSLSMLGMQNAYMRAFLSDYTLRDACFRCPFKSEGSKADITLGDLWGIESILPSKDNNVGTTIIIPRTDRGNALVDKIKVRTEVDFNQVAHYNPSLLYSAVRPVRKSAFDSEWNKKKSSIKIFNKYASEPKNGWKYRILHTVRIVRRVLRKFIKS